MNICVRLFERKVDDRFPAEIAVGQSGKLTRFAKVSQQHNLQPTRSRPLQSRQEEDKRNRYAGSRCWLRAPRLIGLAFFFAVLLLSARPASATPNGTASPVLAVPETPQPQLPSRAKAPAVEPCHIKRDGKAELEAAAAAAMATNPANPVLDRSLKPAPCPPLEPLIDWYARFLNGPKVKPMTPKEKAWLAVRNVGDPFNALTILGLSGIAVASNSHSPYGPGMPGFARYAGVSYTQDITGEFFGTFLIASLAHQDPHYHRMPNASIPRRAGHAMLAVLWDQGDNGKGMVNYAGLGSGAINDALGNLYVPGQKTNLPASFERYGIGVATAPIDNFVTEFLPDVARRIHVRVVLIQQIINQVAKTGGS